MIKKIIYGILLVGWMGVIFAFSHQNAEASKQLTSDIASDTIEQLEKVEGEVFEESTVFVEENHWEWVDKIFTPLRKMAHLLVFFVYGFLLFNFVKEFKFTFKELLIAVLVLGLFYAVFDEFHQTFIPGRAGLLKDVFINYVGAILGSSICLLFNKKLYLKR